jgi:hypothetical protein
MARSIREIVMENKELLGPLSVAYQGGNGR